MQLYNGIAFLQNQVNNLFGKQEPWKIVMITTSSVLSAVWFYQLLSKDESLIKRTKKRIFKLARRIPAINDKIQKELDKVEKQFEDEISKFGKDMGYITKLPENPLVDEEIMKKLREYLELGHYKWKDGMVSGAVYAYNQKTIDLITEVYRLSSYTNPLHPDVFPGVCKMEAEVVRMLCNLFNGGPNSCGTMTTGGTESIMMACKAFRDYARDVRGVEQPNIVASVTAHTAFDKAAQYLGFHVRVIKTDPKTYEVDIKAMEKAINRNTVVLVGSAPNYPYGTMDDIEAIAKLGKKYNIPVHVDACLGGFLIIFMKRAGYYVRKFDFSLDGVTSISVDTHKYGFTPKGSSVILYSDKKFRHHQYTVTTEWPGGVYGSPTVNGSRAGGVIAATWATMLSYGLDGYVECTKSIVDTARYIEAELRKVKNIYIFGKPATSVIAMGSTDFDIYRLQDSMCKKGWNLNTLQFPSGIHICVTLVHTKEGMADKFINDIKGIVADLMKNPEKPVEGSFAIYGVAQTLQDRSIVGDFTKLFLDSMFYTPK